MKSLNYLVDHIMYLIFKNILSIRLKNYGEKINDNNNPSIEISVNKLGKRITLKIKRRYYLELLMPETIKLLGSTQVR